MVDSGSSEMVSGQLREVSRTLEHLASTLQSGGALAPTPGHYEISRDPLVKQLAAAHLRQLHARGESYRSIAREFGVTYERVRQLALCLGVEWGKKGRAVSEGDDRSPLPARRLGPSQMVSTIRSLQHRLPG